MCCQNGSAKCGTPLAQLRQAQPLNSCAALEDAFGTQLLLMLACLKWNCNPATPDAAVRERTLRNIQMHSCIDAIVQHALQFIYIQNPRELSTSVLPTPT